MLPMFEPLQKILPHAASHYNFTAQMKAIQICQEYRNLAPSLLPHDALIHTFPKSYVKKTLIIGVYNSMWAQQILIQRHRILEAINAKFGAETVKAIKIETVQQNA